MNFNEQELETRKNIINVARRLAMADGLFNLSVEEITKEAKISEETFHKFFKNTEEVVSDLANTRFGLSDENVLSLPLDEKIKMFATELIKQIETSSIDTCRGWINSNLKPSDDSLIFSDKELVKKILNSSVKSGELKTNAPVTEISEFVISIVYGMMLNWCMTGAKFEPLEHIDTINELIVNSLGAYKN